MARIQFEITDAKKDKFKKIINNIDKVDMSVILRDFVTQWLEEQDKLADPGQKFIVVSLNSELYRTITDQAMHQQEDLAHLVREYLDSWAG